jgi:hypothetical protein
MKTLVSFFLFRRRGRACVSCVNLNKCVCVCVCVYVCVCVCVCVVCVCMCNISLSLFLFLSLSLSLCLSVPLSLSLAFENRYHPPHILSLVLFQSPLSHSLLSLSSLSLSFRKSWHHRHRLPRARTWVNEKEISKAT